MFINHLKMAWRHLKKKKLFSVIHIFSLTLGITSAFLILLYVSDEMSYDRFHEKGERIVRLTRQFSPDPETINHFARSSNAWQPWMDTFRETYPEIEHIARLTRRSGTVLEIGENKFSEKYFFITDPEVFDVFTIPLIAGDPETVLEHPYSVVITESMAAKYEGSDVIGKRLNVINAQGEKTAYQISGIMKDWPTNSHIRMNFLASNTEQDLSRDWAYTYLLLKPNTDYKHLEGKFPEFIREHFGDRAADLSAIYLQKLTDIHLYSHLDREITANGDINAIYVLMAVLIFIIIITCVNTINLSTAQIARRHKEIGIRRIIGSEKKHLAMQFLTESLLITGIATVVSLSCILFVLPEFNQLANKSLSSQISPSDIILYFTLVLIIGLLSAFYPVLFLTRPRALTTFQTGIDKSGHPERGAFRNFLVTLQFGLSVFLLISTFVLRGQMSYVQNKSLGFNKDQVISVGKNISQTARAQFPILRNRLLDHPGVVNVSASMEEPSYEVKDMGSCFVESIREGNDRAYLYILPVDEHFFDLMEIDMVTGETFPPLAENYRDMTFIHGSNFVNEINSTSRSYILNETAIKQIGFESVEESIGKNMDWQNSLLNLKQGPIIGVVQDFHFSTLHKKIKPFVLILEPRFLGSVLIKLKTDDISKTIGEIEKTWNQMFPECPFEYHFLDDLFAELYHNEKRLQDVIVRFTGIAILISCLGLFALVLHSATQRTKEIGVRKVLGASVTNILQLLTIDYLRWIVVANFVAWPAAWLVMRKWLQNFAYRIDLTIWPFILSALLALIIALLTVSWHVVRAAMANPVESLRYE